MVFSAPEFLFLFLPLTVLAFYLARRLAGHDASLWVLLGASLIFYSWWDVRFLPLLLGSIVLNFGFAYLIRRGNSALWTGIGVTANLALLAVFKYADFLVENLNAATGADLPLPGLPLPLAISFFTFQQIAFLVDTSRRTTEPSRADRYGLFVAFFPQLIAGPIVHHRTMAPQLADRDRPSKAMENISIGLSIFAIGLAKKVLIADTVAPYSNAAFDTAASGEPVGLLLAWSGALAYAMQIYFDFSGYSDMALGLGRMFGFQLPVNFNAPYRSRSITEFWRRWHITLSHFLRDYLYISLGGNRAGQVRTLINLMIVMLLGGLWHGAAWTFVVWGWLHGLALIWCRLMERLKPGGLFRRLPWVSVGVTFLFVVITWVFFRAESFDAAWIMLAGMAGASGIGGGVGDEPFIALVICFLLIWRAPETTQFFFDQIDPALRKEAGLTPPRRLRWTPTRRTAVLIAALLFICAVNTWGFSEFIYYNF